MEQGNELRKTDWLSGGNDTIGNEVMGTWGLYYSAKKVSNYSLQLRLSMKVLSSNCFLVVPTVSPSRKMIVHFQQQLVFSNVVQLLPEIHWNYL